MDVDEVSTVALLLRRYRLAAGISQSELAERANVSVAAIGSLEQGVRKSPYPFTLNSLADALGLTPDERTALISTAKTARGRHRTSESGTAIQSNVPVPLTSFVPRAETVELEQLLLKHRLVTVTGTAGVGKTRTVLEVAGQYKSSDVTFIDLSPITDNDLVAAEIASAFGVPAVVSSAILPDLISRIGERRSLIILDCCERVLKGACAIVLALLRSCPGLRFVATSREPLGLSNEAVFRLPSLAVPPMDADLGTDETYPALELFLLRAFTADARITVTEDDVKAAADVCRRLDGIPLAIELAAARAPLLGITGLRDRLSVLSLDSVAKDVPARHKTMASAIEWSFTLLNDRERQLMRRLSIFSGSFTLQSAEAVCADDELPVDSVAVLIFELVRKSLVETRMATPANRYYLLDSVRAYATLELSTAGEGDIIASRLADWFLEFARRDHDHGLAAVVSMLPDLDNIRAAIEIKIRNGSNENVAIAGELVGAYRHLWMSTNRQLELRQLCEAVTRLLDEGAYIDVAALLANAMAGTAESAQRTDLLEKAIEVNQRAGNDAAVAAHFSRLAGTLVMLGRQDKALECAFRAEQVLRRVSHTSRAQHYVRTNIASVFRETGDLARARRALVELDEIKAEQSAGDDPDSLLHRNRQLAGLEFVSRNFDLAVALCRETIEKLGSFLPQELSWLEIRLYLIDGESLLDHVEIAERECRRLLAERSSYNEFGFETRDAEVMASVGLIAAKRGLSDTAMRLLTYSEETFTRLGLSRHVRNRLVANEIRSMFGTLSEAQDAVNGMTPDEARQLASSVLAAPTV